jgi:hypothetical protein
MTWTLKLRFALATAGMAMMLACGGGDKAAAPAAGAAASIADGDFGVPECDSYMKKYVACIESKVPESGRAMLKQGLDQTKAAWKQAAATPQGKAGLAQACVQAETAAKQAMGAYGCTW